MNGTIPCDDTAQGTVRQLEERIKVLDRQISAYRDALFSRDAKIRMLEEEAKLAGAYRPAVDCGAILERARKGLELVRSMRSDGADDTLRDELRKERIRNLKYQCIIEDLTGRIKELGDSS